MGGGRRGAGLLEDAARLPAALVGVETWFGPWPFVEARRFLGELGCWLCNTRLVMRLSPGCSSRGTVLMRPDLRRPSRAVNVDGPSASIFFQGGDSSFGFRSVLFGVVSRTRRRLAGGPSSKLVSSRALRTPLRGGAPASPSCSAGSPEGCSWLPNPLVA